MFVFVVVVWRFRHSLVSGRAAGISDTAPRRTGPGRAWLVRCNRYRRGVARYVRARRGTVRYGMVWYDMARYGMVWYGMVWYGMVWHGMAWYGMVWYGMVWHGMVWYGMVWYGMAWYGMVWCGMMWYGVVWYGTVRDGTVRVVFNGGDRQCLSSCVTREYMHCSYIMMRVRRQSLYRVRGCELDDNRYIDTEGHGCVYVYDCAYAYCVRRLSFSVPARHDSEPGCSQHPEAKSTPHRQPPSCAGPDQ